MLGYSIAEKLTLLTPPSYFLFLICHFLRRMADFYKKIFQEKRVSAAT